MQLPSFARERHLIPSGFQFRGVEFNSPLYPRVKEKRGPKQGKAKKVKGKREKT
jgi:hypothetical protein